MSSPCVDSTALFAVTTCFPASMARRMYSRAGSMPPISSTTRSLRPTRSSKSPSVRVSTPAISGRIPVACSIAGARSSSSSWNADPTVPRPSRPTLNVTSRQVVEGLAADHHPGIAAGAEDDGWAGQRVVVARHGVAVRAGGGDHQHVTRAGVREHHVADQDVARLAVLPGDGAEGVAAEAIRHLRLVAGAVEHGAQVVRHPAVDGHVGAHAGNLLDGADRVDRDAGVAH